MGRPAFIIFASTQSPWRIGICGPTGVRLLDVALPADAAPKAIAVATAQALQEQGYGGEGLILALPGDWCLCAAVSSSGLPRKEARQALVYRLEEKLPIAAEDIAADFLAVGSEALGVCVELARVAPLVVGLEENGVAVEHVTPAALLALQAQLRKATGEQLDAVLWADGSHVNLFALEGRKPRSWYQIPANNTKDLAMHLGLLALARREKLRLGLFGIAEETAKSLSGFPDAQVVHWADESIFSAATRLAPEIQTGKLPPWIELRQDGLAAADPYRQIRRPLTFALLSALLLAMGLSGAMLLRGWHYRQFAGQQQLQQDAFYRQVFPNRPLPPSPKLYLLSEERRLRGLSGQSSVVPQGTSALELMYQALRRLPTDLRYRLVELRFEDEKLYLEGQARSHSDADAIAAALRLQQGFAVDPPRSEQLAEKGISFTLTASAPPRHPSTRSSLP